MQRFTQPLQSAQRFLRWGGGLVGRRRSQLYAVALLWVANPVAAGNLTNQLANHPSPYLAMHGDDPVHWQFWSASALRKAQQMDRIIFLSIGYFSCYWCHVMHRESYLNDQIAAHLNRDFVAIKVDRELNPALDQVMLNYVEMTRGYAGWPLNVFLTPQGGPLFGLVYAPPDRFEALLTEIAKRWQTEREALRALGSRAHTQLAEVPPETAPLPLPLDAEPLKSRFLQQAMDVADEVAGGFGDQAKFPSVPQLSTLLIIYARSPEPELRQFLELSLHAMASQGLRDQIGGGFFRYVVDPTWEMPHFEKMLYDNVLLADLYLRAARVLEADWMRAVGLDTLDFVLRDFGGEGGGLISSLSAVDEQGREGRFYLWDSETLERVLTQREQAVVAAAWGLGVGPTEHGYLARQLAGSAQVAEAVGVSPEQALTLLESARSKLLRERARRELPADGKRLAAWNGLALGALATAASEDGGEAYRQKGQALRDYLLGFLWDPKAGLLRVANSEGAVPATLEDYAYVAYGMSRWAEIDGNENDMQWVARLVAQAWQRFATGSGWRLSEDTLIPWATTQAVIPDSALPSPSALLLDVSLRLSAHSQDPQLYSKVMSAARRGGAELAESPFFYATEIALVMNLVGE